MNSLKTIRCAQSTAANARQAVREFHSGIVQENIACVVFFCSSHYDLDALAEEMNLCFPGVLVFGCTTAGEIGPHGYCDHSLTGASFPSEYFSSVAGLHKNLRHFDYSEGREFSRALLQQLGKESPHAGSGDSFGLLLIDGLSAREEIVARSFQNGMGRVSLVGGSAGDDMKLRQTLVFSDGAFHPDSAVLILMSTACSFKVFKTQHFSCRSDRFVVTGALPERRLVTEINGRPAAREYARMIGVPYESLSTSHFATNPVVVVIGGTNYVRSIQSANPDESLTFFCAIEEGLVLRLGQGSELMGSLESTFAEIRREVGPPQAVCVCDCILRNMEISLGGLKDAVEMLFRQNKTVGFSSYGEQIDGVHVNQTLTGIAIGQPGERHV